MAAIMSTVGITANIGLIAVEIGLIGTAASVVVLGIWGIHKSRKAL